MDENGYKHIKTGDNVRKRAKTDKNLCKHKKHMKTGKT